MGVIYLNDEEWSKMMSNLPSVIKQGMCAKEQGFPFEHNPYKSEEGKEEESNFWEMGWVGKQINDNPTIYLKRGELY